MQPQCGKQSSLTTHRLDWRKQEENERPSSIAVTNDFTLQMNEQQKRTRHKFLAPTEIQRAHTHTRAGQQKKYADAEKRVSRETITQIFVQFFGESECSDAQANENDSIFIEIIYALRLSAFTWDCSDGENLYVRICVKSTLGKRRAAGVESRFVGMQMERLRCVSFLLLLIRN